ncbi:MAG: 5-(carboxyamino)imidazole ribonucleotide mutase [Desulfobulbus propionicus]|nr:MAG: 5-(carboxyamino)imidazole ribonucleotide mutase [Desulfobulbus propionicus]
MKILVIGGGGREHALVWKLQQSHRVTTLYCAPGNAGIDRRAIPVDVPAEDIKGLAAFAQKKQIDLTVVGPEAPLTDGIVDLFQQAGLRIFGPTAKAAELEGSKVFTKGFLEKYAIPSAAYQVFSGRGPAKKYIERLGAPCVVKADGLAAGKGVFVCMTSEEGYRAVDLIMKERAFGAAGKQVVVEAFLSGEEASFIAFTDGTTILPLPSSQDHKAAFDGDTGPNTGGMGAYSPAPVLTPALEKRVMEEVMLPAVQGMAAEGRPYVGMLYAGLMIDGDTINVLEFNCRFGDPECQPLLMRLRTDLVDIFEACIDQRLHTLSLEVDPRPAVCVVMASGGYPERSVTGKPILGLRAAAKLGDVMVFHAATRIENRRTVTSGGRVLGVTALGDTLEQAVTRAYQAVAKISWEDCRYRKDIGHRALARLASSVVPQVGIVMGSDSDLPVMESAAHFLESLGIACSMRIASAHRTPDAAVAFAREARQSGLKVIIAGAGMAAHLAGVLAAHTTLPVIGVPLDAGSFGGLDALLSTVQMPPGIPVASMGIGKAGARNAAIMAARILAIDDAVIAAKLAEHAREMAAAVELKNAQLCR